MRHITTIENTPEGHLGRCETCGDRNTEFTGYGVAFEWCDLHTHAPRFGQRGARPGLTALEAYYRERSEMLVFTIEERRQWLTLADELAERLKAKYENIEGQMQLFNYDESQTKEM